MVGARRACSALGSINLWPTGKVQLALLSRFRCSPHGFLGSELLNALSPAVRDLRGHVTAVELVKLNEELNVVETGV